MTSIIYNCNNYHDVTIVVVYSSSERGRQEVVPLRVSI